jgi:hypothetical protein
MLIEKDTSEEVIGGEVNPDALEAVLEEEITVDDEDLPVDITDEDEDDDADEIDIAFAANDEGYW